MEEESDFPEFCFADKLLREMAEEERRQQINEHHAEEYLVGCL